VVKEDGRNSSYRRTTKITRVVVVSNGVLSFGTMA
jgi:hypothetical protein